MRGSNDIESDHLRTAFDKYVISEHTSRPVNYSVRLSRDARTFHTLHRGSCMVLGSPDPQRILGALVRHVEAHAPASDGTVAMQALAVLDGGGVTLVPTLLEEDLRSVERRLTEEGVALLDAPFVSVDLQAGELVVEPWSDVDHAALDELAALAPTPRRLDPPIPEGRYPLRRWLFMDYWQAPGPYSRATATRRAALLVRGGPGAAGPDVLQRLAALFESVEAAGIDPASRDETLSLFR